jgi:hypothetical protein
VKEEAPLILGTRFDAGREGLVAKTKSDQKVTKSDFLRKALGRNPNLDLRQVNRQWAKKGHAGEISCALFSQIRAERPDGAQSPSSVVHPVSSQPGDDPRDRAGAPRPRVGDCR